MEGRPHLVLGILWQIIRMGLFANIDLALNPSKLPSSTMIFLCHPLVKVPPLNLVVPVQFSKISRRPLNSSSSVKLILVAPTEKIVV